jgi:hypothetical protein
LPQGPPFWLRYVYGKFSPLAHRARSPQAWQ